MPCTKHKTSTIYLAFGFALAACGDDAVSPPSDAGRSGEDAGALDAARTLDAATDAPAVIDAGADAAPIAGDAGLGPRVTEQRRCGVGPIRRPAGFTCPTENCPAAPPDDAIPVVYLSSCPIGRDGESCDPIPGPECGYSAPAVLSMNLVNPNPGERPLCWGFVDVQVEPSPDGTAQVRWHVTAVDEDCSEVGTAEGEYLVDGFCCAVEQDYYFPHGEFTFRLRAEVEWVVPE
jgi:hypothetical protein